MNNRFIQKLTIENFKSIRQLQNFELRNINILIGANGCGKSNFLSFFSLLRNLIEKNLGGYVAKHGSTDGILTFGRKNSQYLAANIEFEKNEYGFKLLPTNNNKFYFDDEYTIDKENSRLYHFSNNDFESVLNNDKENSRDYYLDYYITPPFFKKILQYHFHDTGDSSPIKSDDYVYENEQLKFDGKNIAAFIRRLYVDYRYSYDLIVKTIRLVVPDFYDFSISENVKSNEQITLYWINKNDRDSIQHPSFLSDGSLRFICLVTVLLQPLELMPDIIIIDEPELGLHPQALTIIANLIERISLQKQFVIATQSSSFIDFFLPEDIIVVDKNTDGTSKFTRQSKENLKLWLEEEYNLSELWDMNLIGGRP